MQWTDESGGAYGSDPYGGIGYTHARGHEGVRTTMPPEVGESARPVFVDASGRRQRRALRAARLLVIPAGGYVALLIGALLGGPSISSPFVPQSDAHPDTPRTTAPDPASATGHSKDSATAAARKNAGSAARQTPGRPAASTAPAATAAPSTTNTSSSRPGSKANPASKGRALGSSHKPVK
ncbi:hypothetical protein ABZ864_33965 [Streptomyces sp. NPDC047082]|uniref:hypothetical protein n=1 Tax=Streptomyces sp. NPDC047082 TaxID=3155259 RepID=UPI0033E665B8